MPLFIGRILVPNDGEEHILRAVVPTDVYARAILFGDREKAGAAPPEAVVRRLKLGQGAPPAAPRSGLKPDPLPERINLGKEGVALRFMPGGCLLLSTPRRFLSGTTIEATFTWLGEEPTWISVHLRIELPEREPQLPRARLQPPEVRPRPATTAFTCEPPLPLCPLPSPRPPGPLLYLSHSSQLLEGGYRGRVLVDGSDLAVVVSNPYAAMLERPGKPSMPIRGVDVLHEEDHICREAGEIGFVPLLDLSLPLGDPACLQQVLRQLATVRSVSTERGVQFEIDSDEEGINQVVIYGDGLEFCAWIHEHVQRQGPDPSRHALVFYGLRGMAGDTSPLEVLKALAIYVFRLDEPVPDQPGWWEVYKPFPGRGGTITFQFELGANPKERGLLVWNSHKGAWTCIYGGAFDYREAPRDEPPFEWAQETIESSAEAEVS